MILTFTLASVYIVFTYIYFANHQRTTNYRKLLSSAQNYLQE